MVADVDVRLTFFKILASIEFVAYEGELAKGPRPEIKEEVSDASKTLTQQKRADNPGKVENHEHGKHEEDPYFVQVEDEGEE